MTRTSRYESTWGGFRAGHMHTFSLPAPSSQAYFHPARGKQHALSLRARPFIPHAPTLRRRVPAAPDPQRVAHQRRRGLERQHHVQARAGHPRGRRAGGCGQVGAGGGRPLLRGHHRYSAPGARASKHCWGALGCQTKAAGGGGPQRSCGLAQRTPRQAGPDMAPSSPLSHAPTHMLALDPLAPSTRAAG